MANTQTQIEQAKATNGFNNKLLSFQKHYRGRRSILAETTRTSSGVALKLASERVVEVDKQLNANGIEEFELITNV